MSRTLAKEIEMGDLTVALMDLSGSAEGRKLARRGLREAVNVVAMAIVKRCRAGDRCEVEGRKYEIVSRHWPGSQWGDDSNPAMSPLPANVLVVDGVALCDVRESWHDGHNLFRAIGPGYTKRDGDAAERMATDDVREVFARDAAQVIASLARLQRSGAESMSDAADSLARLSPL